MLGQAGEPRIVSFQGQLLGNLHFPCCIWDIITGSEVWSVDAFGGHPVACHTSVSLALNQPVDKSVCHRAYPLYTVTHNEVHD